MVAATWYVVTLTPSRLRRVRRRNYERAEMTYRLRAASGAPVALVRGDGVMVAKSWGEP